MTRTSSLVVRACAAGAGSLVLALGGAGASHASTVPDPLSSAVASTTQTTSVVTGALPPAPLPTSLPVPVPTELPEPLTRAVQSTGLGAATTSGTAHASPTGGPTGGSPASAQQHQAGSAAETSAAPGASGHGTTGASETSAPPAQVRATTDVATVCLIPTGSTSPAFALDLSVVGNDLSSPLVQQFPQVFTPCPPNTVPASGDTVVAADASVRDLLGACVRLSRAGLPGQTTVVVLDKNLIDELTRVGLPLDQLVVPCPAGAGAGALPGDGGHTGGASSTPAAFDAGGNAAAPAAEHSGLLAFTGARVLPAVALAALLLTLGWFFLRTSARLAPVARRG